MGDVLSLLHWNICCLLFAAQCCALRLSLGDTPSRATGLFSESPATVTFGTLITMDADVLPLQMLRHQLKGLCTSGHARFEEVRVYLNQGITLPKDIENELKDVSAKVKMLDKPMLSNRSIVQRFVKYPEGLTLDQLFPDDMYFDQVLAITSFLNDCSSIYCVWMDPDIFVHKASNGQGWVDYAMVTMDDNSTVSLMTRPTPNLLRGTGRTETNCENRESSFMSQRHMVIHKDRFLKELPIQLTCAPDCDTWEAVISNHHFNSTFLDTHCGGRGFWVMHPPQDKDHMLETLRSCSPDRQSIDKGLNVLLEHIETTDAPIWPLLLAQLASQKRLDIDDRY